MYAVPMPGVASRSKCFLACACAWVILAVCALPAHAETAADAITSLNALREANGIPGGVTENSNWSTKCLAHSNYGNLNSLLTHGEDAALPGYSVDGDWAGKNSVLASGGVDWSTSNPWINAPVHLYQLLFPGLKSTGYGEYDGYGCMTTWPGADFFAGSATYTYPGRGATGVKPAQTAHEMPFVPQQFINISEGTATGPNIFFYRTDYDVDIDSVTVKSSTGKIVDTGWVDYSSATIGPYLPRGAILIPKKPLDAKTTYLVQVKAHNIVKASETVDYSWSFSTVGASAIEGSGTSDRLDGGTGGDRIKGKGGNDKIFGKGGNDRLWGDAGDDTITAGAGKDRVWGGAGNDYIDLHDGKPGDWVDCGKGKDYVRYDKGDKLKKNCERRKRG
jgi:Ca2+-binding RTX toxin-like protein